MSDKFSQKFLENLIQTRKAETEMLKRGREIHEAVETHVLHDEYVSHHVANSVQIEFTHPDGSTSVLTRGETVVPPCSLWEQQKQEADKAKDLVGEVTFFVEWNPDTTSEKEYRERLKAMTEAASRFEIPQHAGIAYGTSPTMRYPQLQQIPRNPAVAFLAAAASPQYQALLDAWRKQNREVSAVILDEMAVAWEKFADIFDERSRYRNQQAELYAAFYAQIKEPVKQKPYWMQLQDKQQKRQRGRHGKVFTKQK